MAGKHVILRTVPVGDLFLSSSLPTAKICKVISHEDAKGITRYEDEYGNLEVANSHYLVYVD